MITFKVCSGTLFFVGGGRGVTELEIMHLSTVGKYGPPSFTLHSSYFSSPSRFFLLSDIFKRFQSSLPHFGSREIAVIDKLFGLRKHIPTQAPFPSQMRHLAHLLAAFDVNAVWGGEISGWC